MTALAYSAEKGIHEHVTSHAISEALEEDRLVWLDITGPTQEDAELLEQELGIHPLASEDLEMDHHRSRCSEFPGVYVLVLFTVGYDEENRIKLNQLVIYAAKNYLVTAHAAPLPEITETRRRWEHNVSLFQESIAAPLFSLLDTVVDGYFPVLDNMADCIDELEDRIFSGESDVNAQDLFTLKRDMLDMRRAVSGQRDAINVLLRQDVPILPPNSVIYFQSVYDHLVRLVESIDTYRDLLSSAMDLHLSVVSNRMNQVMKTLTAVSTILMSAGLVAGIYGMNFSHMPELSWRYGYAAALALMVSISVGLTIYFKKIRWL
jgi:magnesium transporter